MKTLKSRYAICSRKGNSVLPEGLIFAPYIPVMSTPIIISSKMSMETLNETRKRKIKSILDRITH